MPEPATVQNDFGLRKKVQINGTIVFDTAWRIGSGREGETMSDLGVLLDSSGQPVLPGSSLKGRLRTTCETLAHALGLSACLLNVAASNVPCVSDVKYYTAKQKNGKTKREEYRDATKKSLPARLAWIDEHTCDVCKLFGSPVRASRLRISDGQLEEWSQIVQVRDGVVLDRDSHTAVKGLKYDYEVVPAGARFTITMDLDNPTTTDLALLGAAVFEWHSGSSIGGFTSRGLGRFRLQDVTVKGVDFQNPQQRFQYLTNHAPKDKMSELGAWDTYFSENIQAQLNARADDAKEA